MQSLAQKSVVDEATLKELQETELNILRAFSTYCKNNGLTYYLIGGALLGTARYKKFIPWDNDIDVAMFREDYEKFQRLWNEKPLEGFFLQSAKTDHLFSRCILKLRMDKTHIIEKACAGIEMHDGIYIDIFPIDYVNHLYTREMNFRAWRIRKLMTLRTIKAGYNSDRYKIFKRIIKLLLVFAKSSTIDDQIERLCTKENHGTKKYGVLYLHNYPWRKQIHPIEIFGTGTYSEFCGMRVCIPKNTDAFLRKVFGDDYMEEPPVEKQKQPHNYLEIQIDRDVLNEMKYGERNLTGNG